VLHATRWKYRTEKLRKNCHVRTIAQLCRAISSQLTHVSTIGKNLLKTAIIISSRCLHNIMNVGTLMAEVGWRVWGTSLGHPSTFQGVSRLNSLRYCSDVAHWRPTKPCTMFGRLLGWCTIYTFSGALAP